MASTTRIDPAIAFRRSSGKTSLIRDAAALADWLDDLYDAILDPRRTEGAGTWEDRSLQLHEIEQVLFALSEETGAGTISPKLRSVCMAVIARYRDLISLPVREAGGPRPGIAHDPRALH